MIILLITIPMMAAGLTYIFRRRWLTTPALIATAVTHSFLTTMTWFFPSIRVLNRWIAIDDFGLLFLSITSLLFLCTSIYGITYLRHEHKSVRREAPFVSCLLLFLATMTLVALSQHLELLWVGIEGTTLASAPLIYFQKSQHSLEATWKYLMIGSVGIAVALLGNFFFAVSTISPVGITNGHSLFISDLIEKASQLQIPWVRAAFIFYIVGYGTKMGLAPLHSWLPDAHSESPSFVSALLSGSLLNCAFLGILRGYQICLACGQSPFAQNLFLVMGIISIAFGAIFIMRQNDYKRMLAYSSVEHMGILSLSMGIGGSAIFGGMLHMINHSLTKAMLFMVSGNIVHVYKTKSAKLVSGIFQTLPFTGILWLLGFFAITGSPPFGTFISKFIVIKAAFQSGHEILSIVFLICLTIIGISMASIFLKMTHGAPPATVHMNLSQESHESLIPSILLGLMVLILGLYIPPFLYHHLQRITHILGGAT